MKVLTGKNATRVATTSVVADLLTAGSASIGSAFADARDPAGAGADTDTDKQTCGTNSLGDHDQPQLQRHDLAEHGT